MENLLQLFFSVGSMTPRSNQHELQCGHGDKSMSTDGFDDNFRGGTEHVSPIENWSRPSLCCKVRHFKNCV